LAADNILISESELREAFKFSRLELDGWNYERAITTDSVLCGLYNTAIALKRPKKLFLLTSDD
jgi:hypothetical protein